MAIAKNPMIMLVISIVLGVCGQFLFKTGLNKMGGGIDLSWHIVKLFFTPFIGAGVCLYVLSTFTWLSALSKVPLSFAYPMLSSGYIIIYLVSVIFLGEQYSHTKLAAILLIIAGISLLYYGKN